MTITNDVSIEQDKDAAATDDIEAQAGALVEQLFGSVLGAVELASIDLGERLGLYASLAEAPASPAELAQRTGVDQRYVREWCEQQAVAGILTADDNEASDDRRFTLPVGHQVVLLDPDSLAYGLPLARFVSVIGPVLPALLHAYRTGTGVPYADYGADTREIIALGNRPLFTNLLAQAWLPELPDVHARLQAGGARVADVACGCGWSSIAIARAYPAVSVDGFDADEDSIVSARANAKAAGVDDRVRFEVRNAGDAPPGGYDLVCCFESLHDMAQPVSALAAMGAMAGPDGTVFIADEKVADQFTAPGDPVERWMYACSVLHCLPVGRAAAESAATGTVMRTSTLEHYAADAGFASVEVLPIEHDLWRFYRLHR